VALLPYCIQFPLDWEKNQKKGAGTGASTASGESCPVERPGWWCKPGALQVMAMCTPLARPDRRRYAAVPFTPRSRARASVRLTHRRALPMSTFRVAARVLGLAALVLLAACATGPRITTEGDPEADFSRYRTFGFY